MTDVIILVISAALGLGIWMVYGYLKKLRTVFIVTP